MRYPYVLTQKELQKRAWWAARGRVLAWNVQGRGAIPSTRKEKSLQETVHSEKE